MENGYDVYAIISDENVVEDLKVFKTSNDALDYVNSIFLDGKAVLVSLYVVWPGDVYVNGKFYRVDEHGDYQQIQKRPDVEKDNMSYEIIGKLKERVKYLETLIKEKGIEYV